MNQNEKQVGLIDNNDKNLLYKDIFKELVRETFNKII